MNRQHTLTVAQNLLTDIKKGIKSQRVINRKKFLEKNNIPTDHEGLALWIKDELKYRYQEDYKNVVSCLEKKLTFESNDWVTAGFPTNKSVKKMIEDKTITIVRESGNDIRNHTYVLTSRLGEWNRLEEEKAIKSSKKQQAQLKLISDLVSAGARMDGTMVVVKIPESLSEKYHGCGKAVAGIDEYGNIAAIQYANTNSWNYAETKMEMLGLRPIRGMVSCWEFCHFPTPFV